MELLAYWKIIWRHFWVLVIVVGVVGLYVSYSYIHTKHLEALLHSYNAEVTVQIGVSATAQKTYSNADDISVSESLTDAFVQGPILTSSTFDNAVENQISQDSAAIQQKWGATPDFGNCKSASAIGSALTATRIHSLVTITANCTTDAGAWAVANAVGEVVTTRIGYFLDYVVNSNATLSSYNPSQADISARLISNVSEPVLVPGTTANSKLPLYIALLVVALAVSLALVFLLEYLDDHIREKDQAASLLGLPVLGEVPGAPAPGRR